MRFLDAGRADTAVPDRLAAMLGPAVPRVPGSFGGVASAPPGEDAPPGHLRSAELAGPGDPPPERWATLRRLLEHGRTDPGLPGARALAVAGVGAALLAGGYLWLSQPEPEAAPPAAGTPTLAAPSGPAVAASPSAVVHVAGTVRRPGVVTLPAGSRVTDAITAAGGVRPGTGTGALNLARKVIDGEQILVGASGPAAAQGGSAAPGPGPAGGVATPVDLNAATSEQMQQLPGVGPVLAQRIIDYRTQHGGFRTVEELRQVTGIGGRRFADLKDLVRV